MKKTLNIALILLITALNSGAGYIDPPPMIGDHPVNSTSTSVKENPDPIIPMAPTTTPIIVVKKGKYSEYLKDLNDIIPQIEDMKTVLTTQDKDVQMFCAKANVISLNVNSIQKKYGNKTERYYESYKQLGILSRNLDDTANYWRYTYRYNKLLRGSAKDKQADQWLMSAKLKTALNSINTTLEILKENTRPDN